MEEILLLHKCGCNEECGSWIIIGEVKGVNCGGYNEVQNMIWTCVKRCKAMEGWELYYLGTNGRREGGCVSLRVIMRLKKLFGHKLRDNMYWNEEKRKMRCKGMKGMEEKKEEKKCVSKSSN